MIHIKADQESEESLLSEKLSISEDDESVGFNLTINCSTLLPWILSDSQ